MQFFQDTKIWYTQEIVPLPSEVYEVENPVIPLNSDDQWTFLFSEIPTIPLPTDKSQDFLFEQVNGLSWDKVVVPGELSMQGFAIENNKEYYYKREISLPKINENKRVLIRFDGVYSKARVWINGSYVRNHTGGFTTWDCDITSYIKELDCFTLVVGVADIEGTTQGIYNPDGKKQISDPSRASHYAHHCIGGILRDVSVIILPSTYIARLHTDTRFENQWEQGVLSVRFNVRFPTQNTSVKYTLLDGEKVVGTGNGILVGTDLSEITAEMVIHDPKLWDAEHPNLYTLQSQLYVDNICLQENRSAVGFREIWYGGAKGSDSNKIYVNGKQVKLRGVCRHDISFGGGRSTTAKEDYAEVKAYKEHNINHVRTSHYPPSKHFLDACDELGMYVEEETAVCFQSPFDNIIYSSETEFMNQFTEMIERDRNRASVLIWSLGNESGFEVNSAFRTEYKYVKAVDISRPVKYSFPFTIASLPIPYDIISAHYKSVETNLGHLLLPVLHDEFAHIACYNIKDLQNDPNVRNFWGESIKMAWESIFTTDGALGADIWGGIDEIFNPQISLERLQPPKGPGRAIGYGAWGSVLDVYRRLKPEAYLTKKAYSPVRIDEKKAVIHEDVLLVPIKNWHDHTCFSELSFECFVNNEPVSVEIIVPNLSPHGCGELRINGIVSSWNHLTLNVSDKKGRIIDDFLFKLDSYTRFRPQSNHPVRIEETDTNLIIKSDSVSYILDKKTALLCEIIQQENRLPISGPFFHVENDNPVHTWIPAKKGIQWVVKDNVATVLLTGAYASGEEIRFYLKIFGDGTLVVEYQTRSTGEFNDADRYTHASELGLLFTIPQSVEYITWDKNGLYTNYPDNHIGRNTGKAYPSHDAAKNHNYEDIPSWDWKDDMWDDFLYPREDDSNGFATNDFKAMRENVNYFAVHFCNSNIVLRVEGTGCDAARIQANADSDTHSLIVNQEWNYNGLAWGNYTGKSLSIDNPSGNVHTVTMRIQNKASTNY